MRINGQTSLKHQVRRIFGRPPEKPRQDQRRVDGTLAHLGYPQIFQKNIFLNIDQRKRWERDSSLALPPYCCVCGTPVEVWLPCFQQNSRLRRTRLVLAEVPHCKAHGIQPSARLVAIPVAFGPQIAALHMIAQSLSFLEQTESLARQGDAPPPWEVFPNYPRDSSGWRQGDAAYWWEEVWTPFWNRLTHSQRATYLSRTRAPPDWQDLASRSAPF